MDITDFKNAILTGKIKELALLECDVEVIKSNKYSYMFGVWRKIVKVYDDHFELETQRIDGTIENCEAYYNAFTNYSGEAVSNKSVFMACR